MVAVIDIGSNSIRMSLYERQDRTSNACCTKKANDGLIGYVEDGDAERRLGSCLQRAGRF